MVLALFLLMEILKLVLLPVAVLVVLDGLQRTEVSRKSGSDLLSLFLLVSGLCRMSW